MKAIRLTKDTAQTRQETLQHDKITHVTATRVDTEAIHMVTMRTSEMGNGYLQGIAAHGYLTGRIIVTTISSQAQFVFSTSTQFQAVQVKHLFH
jgi:hypothetical protein